MKNITELISQTKINTLEELLVDIKDDNLTTVNEVNGLIHNTIELIKSFDKKVGKDG